jgi:ADP-dependent NAD(P)H-hydrate dehydratase
MPRSSPKRQPTRNTQRPSSITRAALRRWALPEPSAGGDKDERGRVLVVGGARELPGAVLLAGVGALRAGAGKLQLAAPRSVAVALGVAVPEALAVGVAETRQGGIAPGAARALAERAARVDALLVGPGMVDDAAVQRLLRALVPRLDGSLTLVLDAAALAPLRAAPDLLHSLGGRAVLTPHAGEMAGVLDVERDEVERDPRGTAARAARELGAVVALKGAETYVAAPDGQVWVYRGGRVGLATSGSGDTLAGVVAGLAARGAEPAQAAAWGVFLHGEAGNVLARRMGPVGFLARELLAEVPKLMR